MAQTDGPRRLTGSLSGLLHGEENDILRKRRGENVDLGPFFGKPAQELFAVFFNPVLTKKLLVLIEDKPVLRLESGKYSRKLGLPYVSTVRIGWGHAGVRIEKRNQFLGM